MCKIYRQAGWGKLGWCTWSQPSWPGSEPARLQLQCSTPHLLSSPKQCPDYARKSSTDDLTVTKQMMKLVAGRGRDSRFTLLSSSTSRVESPEYSAAWIFVHEMLEHCLYQQSKSHLSKCKPSPKKEDHPPAHFRLNEPPGDQGRGVLQTVLHRSERPEVISLVEIFQCLGIMWIC